MDIVNNILSNLSGNLGTILPFVVGLGVLFALVGLNGAIAPQQSAQQRRLQASLGRENASRVVKLEDNDPKGILRLFVPHSKNERTQIARRLRQAGFHRVNAVRTYYLVRLAIAILLPAVFLGLYFALPYLPPAAEEWLVRLARLQLVQVFAIAGVLLALGFYFPSVWLKSRIEQRKLEITRSIPNALDLLQVAVEAGLGFDAAMTRVARELAQASPAIAEEFTIVQLEIQAGKDRDRALHDLSLRTDIDELATFTTVIVQSAEFGTPISEALEAVALEIRQTRELKAQEQANKLPVKMSGVLAGIMMPVLLMITLTPIAIRWVRMWAEGG